MHGQVPLDHKVSEVLRATLDHQDFLESLDCQDHKEIPGLPVRWDPSAHKVQLDLLETLDILVTVDFKVRWDLQGQPDHRDLKDQLGSRDSSDLLDRQVDHYNVAMHLKCASHVYC